MKFNVITLFPDFIESYFDCSIMKRAKEAGVISVNVINPRDFSKSKHKKVDDTPYGGGAGMVLMCEPFFDAYNSVVVCENSKTILLTPQGKPFNHDMSKEFSKYEELTIICGHYEGFDERIRQNINCEEVSVGDFVLTGGELPALCLIDSISRNIEGTLGKIESAESDSFCDNLLEYPQYTKPYEYNGLRVPEVLISGNHAEIAKWRRKEQLKRTKERRPDLYEKFVSGNLSKEDEKLIKEVNEGV
ncbi:MAG: tRNA (guanosine(37)-N1)-methyltransferase TrmD [bacterium]|nr:tRNA (guanosine(37)-N1)-methyltransferase TrmD [bacterium]